MGSTRSGTGNEMEDFPPVFAGYYFFTRMILYSSCLHVYSLLQLGIMKKKINPLETDLSCGFALRKGSQHRVEKRDCRA
jgi:hypothetical protein